MARPRLREDKEDPSRGDMVHQELLREIDSELHALSQPMTALLCLIEYGSSLEASDEMNQIMGWSREASGRLRASVNAPQLAVQRGLAEQRMR